MDMTASTPPSRAGRPNDRHPELGEAELWMTAWGYPSLGGLGVYNVFRIFHRSTHCPIPCESRLFRAVTVFCDQTMSDSKWRR